jgi:hypothetical protein
MVLAVRDERLTQLLMVEHLVHRGMVLNERW